MRGAPQIAVIMVVHLQHTGIIKVIRALPRSKMAESFAWDLLLQCELANHPTVFKVVFMCRRMRLHWVMCAYILESAVATKLWLCGAV